jgi:hypothetical protein
MEWEAEERKSATIHGDGEGFFDYSVMTKDKTSNCYFWTDEQPTEEGLYRYAIQYPNGGVFSCWWEVVDGGGYLGIQNENYVEPLNECIDPEGKSKWLGPLPAPKSPPFIS